MLKASQREPVPSEQPVLVATRESNLHHRGRS